MISFEKGIKIEGVPFHLDARTKVDFSFVSHAHFDHIAPHRKVLATPETLLFFRHRYKKVVARALPLRRKQTIGGVKVELFPSGHILGGAQILLEHRGKRIVYTGDFTLSPGWTSPPAEIPKSDIVIMESTYGLPRYQFPTREEVADLICRKTEETFAQGKTPIFLAYPLGKSQEAAKLLGERGYAVFVHPTIFEICKIYARCGVEFKNLDVLSNQSTARKAVIIPPYLWRSRMAAQLAPKKVFFLSGWGLDEGSRQSFKADEVLPLSDHADFAQLLAYLEEAQPEKVYTLHGFVEFAEILRQRGFDAQSLEAPLETPSLKINADGVKFLPSLFNPKS
ncbi:MAG: MBL fold metallo-hydrolase [candidate division Zixibacteria bacterium]|nr:MBL fold metallo-hydrolase [candidate division Zixibacteria bacterium]